MKGVLNLEERIVLRAIKLKKTYGQGDGVVHALHDVSMEVREGELLVILGSSGSGKSTLLNMIGGMDLPTEGCVFVNGQNICTLSDRKRTLYRQKKVGFVFQFFNLLQDLTAAENVALTAGLSADDSAVTTVLEQVGLSGRMNNYPAQLSGGEQQRVSIARALIKGADLLLCDEPTGALDYETGRQILVMLEKLVRELGQTVVIVTHTKEIAKMADRVIRMRSGKIESIWENPQPVAAERIEW